MLPYSIRDTKCSPTGPIYEFECTQGERNSHKWDGRKKEKKTAVNLDLNLGLAHVGFSHKFQHLGYEEKRTSDELKDEVHEVCNMGIWLRSSAVFQYLRRRAQMEKKPWNTTSAQVCPAT